MKKLILAIGLVFSLNALASGDHSHGDHGHSHDAPGVVQAPKGGVVKSIESVHVEVVAKGQDIKVYLYSLDLKPADVSGYKIKLTAEMPRTKKKEELVVKATGNMLEASFDAKGVHRYTLVVNISDPRHGHDDKLLYTIEPRK